jgi:small nuclear ribonucleoprotein (snRNP)-like protein
VRPNRLRLLGDFVTKDTIPPIPGVIQKICQEIERRGLDTEGLYQKAGDSTTCSRLMSDMLDSKPVKLRSVDVHVLTGTLTCFLRFMNESIITSMVWNIFSRVAHKQDRKERMASVQKEVQDLPPTNRTTLGFLMVHFLSIVEASTSGLTIDFMSRAVGPTLVGFCNFAGTVTMNAQRSQQSAIINALFEISPVFWASLFDDPHTEGRGGGIKGGAVTRGLPSTETSTTTPTSTQTSSRGNSTMRRISGGYVDTRGSLDANPIQPMDVSHSLDTTIDSSSNRSTLKPLF